MGQVPEYGIIGNGRVARHFMHYLGLLKIPTRQWHRPQPTSLLQGMAQRCNPILLLISDLAILPFIQSHPFLLNKTIVHFSGCLVLADIFSAHPLMTFGPTLYEDEKYQHIPFILENEGPIFSTLLPGLPNPNYHIPRALKPYYHSLCVLSNNFSCLLWLKFYRELQNTLNLPKEVLYPFMMQSYKNLMADPDTALTGPLVRNDYASIASNINALKGDPYKDIYTAFVKAYTKMQPHNIVDSVISRGEGKGIL